jgi:BirA family biotin operon repressor/biotin-[acetyl-CoA-carboxylase] ligase
MPKEAMWFQHQEVSPMVHSPFLAPVYRVTRAASTMDIARRLAQEGAPGGTAVIADYQEHGRGRFPDRAWRAPAGAGLLFTIFFRFNDFSEVPPAFTLRVGLAVAQAADSFLAPHKTQVKWPNDVLFQGKKLAGILTEGDARTLFTGVGVNVLQREFEDGPGAALQGATSLALARQAAQAAGEPLDERARFVLFEEILFGLYHEFAA